MDFLQVPSQNAEMQKASAVTIRRLFLTPLVVAIAGTGLAFYLFARPTNPNQFNYEKVQAGMTRSQVENILGGPPGNHTKRQHFGPASLAFPRGTVDFCFWYYDNCQITVTFETQTGLVSDKEISGCSEPTRAERIISYLKRIF